jgi:hypothetical protein
MIHHGLWGWSVCLFEGSSGENGVPPTWSRQTICAEHWRMFASMDAGREISTRPIGNRRTGTGLRKRVDENGNSSVYLKLEIGVDNLIAWFCTGASTPSQRVVRYCLLRPILANWPPVLIKRPPPERGSGRSRILISSICPLHNPEHTMARDYMTTVLKNLRVTIVQSDSSCLLSSPRGIMSFIRCNLRVTIVQILSFIMKQTWSLDSVRV